ncbi:MAG: sulfite exporter TauE/SafE family protein [Planctomycetes bacterium]|nr:sulfite exporter TauE/SafE family protein [Planctomycetota bacterium]
MDYLWLCLSAIGAGAVNAIAGGGTLLTYPALTAVVAYHFANATSTVSLFPGTLASVVGYRQHLAACRRWIILLIAPSVIGGTIGAVLVEEKTFRFVVPWLILAAAVLFLLQPTIARTLRTQAAALREPSPRVLAGIVLIQFLIGIYGGYFGAGIGILMLSSLSFLGLKDIHEVNALKSVLAFGMNIVAAIVFIARDMVVWRFALAMAVASVGGGYLGARFSVRLRPVVVRWIVIAIAFGLAGYYFVKEFGTTASPIS